MLAKSGIKRLVVLPVVLAGLVLGACSDEPKQKKEVVPHPASLRAGCKVPVPSHGPKIVSKSLAKDISGLGMAWGLVMMADPKDGLFGKALEQRVADQTQQLLADLDMTPQETVYAGKTVPAVSMKITPSRMVTLEALPYVCSVADDRGFWPTE